MEFMVNQFQVYVLFDLAVSFQIRNPQSEIPNRKAGCSMLDAGLKS
ncbi:hypothetical protein D1AOALGA4SA_11621 [Olavius algarvensis Delta 1 endosymbiont]|nr:hypothetical protein D1AOALGA4SA_11621 [Olavius algarvensis Delta 1 endosymbiont]